MSSKKTVKLILQSIGPLIFLYIIFSIDYATLFETLKIIKTPLLFLALIIMVLEIVIRAWRWQTILAALDIYISKIKAVGLFWLGTFAGVITPGRLGELIRVYFLKNQGYSIFRSFFSVIIDRIIDILVLSFLGLLIYLFYLKTVGVYMIFYGILLTLLLVFVFLMVDRRSIIHRIFGQFIKKLFPVDFQDYSHFTFEKLWTGIINLKKEKMIYFFIYLITGWFFYFFARYLIAQSLGLNLSFINVGVVSVLVALITALPISIAGLGTREAAVIYIFGLLGLNRETALIFSLLIFSIDLVSISFGYIPYIKESIIINKIKT